MTSPVADAACLFFYLRLPVRLTHSPRKLQHRSPESSSVPEVLVFGFVVFCVYLYIYFPLRAPNVSLLLQDVLRMTFDLIWGLRFLCFHFYIYIYFFYKQHLWFPLLKKEEDWLTWFSSLACIIIHDYFVQRLCECLIFDFWCDWIAFYVIIFFSCSWVQF